MALYTVPGRAAFRAWLVERKDRNVGRPGRTASCPLATWLRQVNTNRRLHVCAGGKHMILADPTEPNGLFDQMPDWCWEFVEAFDTLVEPGPTDGSIVLSVLDDLD